jgi:hypothetical protein
MVLTNESILNLRRNLREIAEQQNLPARIDEYLECYFGDGELSDVSDASPEELLGAAVQHFRLGEARPPEKAIVALYTAGKSDCCRILTATAGTRRTR